MKEGDIVLTRLHQSDGSSKVRPGLVLCRMPQYGDLLLCGLSTQIRQRVPDFDEVISISDSDFALSGLVAESLVRLGYIGTVPGRDIAGSIGSISPERHRRLLQRLVAHLSTVAGR